jgi:hypothetical protein
MTAMINTGTTFQVKINWSLTSDPKIELEDKIDYPHNYPLSLRGVRSAIAEHYDLRTSDVKINDIGRP